jgi:predicted DNA-binding protein
MNANLENNFKLIEHATIDSLKIRILLSNVTILDTSILDTKTKYIISDSTGEIMEETKIKHLAKEIKFNAYSIKVAIVSQYNFALKKNIDYLEIYLHSKILETDYFNGITIQNIEAIHTKLMAKKVFDISFENFLISSVNDIDIKKDFLTDKQSFLDLTTYLKKVATSSNHRHKGAQRYQNGNIEFNTRKTSTSTSPFLKLYDKELEAIERKNEFFDTYFNVNDLRNLKRIEATLKSTKEVKQSLNLETSNLVSLLNSTPGELNEVISNAVNINLKAIKEVTIKKSKVERSNNLDKMIYIHFANMLDNQNLFFEEALAVTLEHFTDKQNKFRMKKKIVKIYSEEIAEIEHKKVNLKRVELLSLIGWGNSKSLYA